MSKPPKFRARYVDGKKRFRARNKNGWRIPAPGTKSRAVYDQIVAGATPLQISHTLNINVGMVRVLAHRFRNPDWRSGSSRHG
jgi:hypothetical protein